MSVKASVLFEAQYAGASAATVYTVPDLTTTIIDKFTATNITSGSLNLTVYLVNLGGTPGATNTVISVLAIAGNTTQDFTQLQNQILGAGDFISCLASAGSSIVVRGSGREIE